jgi:uncharacterized protein (UPF0335 family)
MQPLPETISENQPERRELTRKPMDEKVREILQILRDHGIDVKPVAVIDKNGHAHGDD